MNTKPDVQTLADQLIEEALEGEPLIVFAQSLKDGGVLDAPQRLEDLAAEVAELRQALATWQGHARALADRVATLEGASEVIGKALAVTQAAEPRARKRKLTQNEDGDWIIEEIDDKQPAAVEGGAP